MPSLPTFSATQTTLRASAYNADLLTRLAQEAIKRDAGESDSPLALEAGWLDLHTLSIETRLGMSIPREEQAGWAHRLRPNYFQNLYRQQVAVHNALADQLGKDRDPSVPLTIIEPSFALLSLSKHYSPYQHRERDSGLCISVHQAATPKSKTGDRADSLLRYEVPRPGGTDILRLGGSDQWFIGSDAFDTRSWLHAILAMDAAGPPTRKGAPLQDGRERFRILSSVSLTTRDLDEPMLDDEGLVPTEKEMVATLNIDVHVNLDAIAAGGSDLINEFTGFILHSLLPAKLAAYASEADARTAGIKDLYACLRPAPPLPFGGKPNDLQPKMMRSRLLPFQQRTVHKLIEREKCAEMAEQDTFLAQDPSGSWTQLDTDGSGAESSDRYAYRRVTGTVVKLPRQKGGAPSRKGKERELAAEDLEDEYGLTRRDKEALTAAIDVSGVRGTMLCEEMGLGKTVEAIGLMLLHRHPLSSAGACFERLLADQALDGDSGGAIRISRSNAAGIADVNGASGSGSQTATAASNRSSPVLDIETPVIDLVKGPPDADVPTFAKWLEEEEGRFAKTKVYDETSRLDVTEVATTLIVTPPSLLKQWINEIHHHAPAVRVCVYEGWKALQDSARKKLADINKQAEKRIAANNSKKRDRERSATVSKYTKKLKGAKGTAVPVREGKAARTANDLAIEVPIKSELRDEIDLRGSSDGSKDPDEVATLLEVTQREFLRYIRAHDVVITTYQDLSKDLTVAMPVASRSRRSTVTYRLAERPRSPLLMAQWWRVCLDEVQMNPDSSAAADMVALIPRANSLAISGTPAKTDIRDLMGSLRFLRVPDLPYNPKMWHRLQQPAMRSAFEGLFRELAIRTTKAEVQSEFHLPPQNRYVVPLTLSPIERHYYNDTLERQRAIIGREGQEGVNNATLRQCLLTLRQICTHIQVGYLDNQRAAGRRMNLGNTLLKSMDEALKKMKGENAAQLLNDTKLHARTLVHRADLLQAQCQLAMDGALPLNVEVTTVQAERLYDTAIEIAQAEIPVLRDEMTSRIAQHKAAAAGTADDAIDIDALAAEDLSADDMSADESSVDEAVVTVGAKKKKKGKKKLTQQERDRVAELLRLRAGIREYQLVMHQALFMKGVLYGKKGEESKALEDEAFTKAEDLRKDLLASHLHQAYEGIAVFQRQIDSKQSKPPIKGVRDLQTDPEKAKGGIQSGKVVECIKQLFSVMNDNALLVVAWRDEIMELLKKPIEADDAQSDGAAEAEEQVEAALHEGRRTRSKTGAAGKTAEATVGSSAADAVEVEEGSQNGDPVDAEQKDEGDAPAIDVYTEGLETQVKIEAYLIAYAAVLSDRKEMMDENRTAIDQQEATRVGGKQRGTKRALMATQAAHDYGIVNDNDDGVRGTLQPLLAERETIRQGRKGKCDLPLRAYQIQLNNLKLGAEDEREQYIAEVAMNTVRSYIREQTEHMDALNKELSIFRSAYNKRGYYFAALQEISDTVRDPEFKDSHDLQRQVDGTATEIDTVMQRLQEARVRSRFLTALGNKDGDNQGAIEAVAQKENPKDDCSCFYQYENRMVGGKECPSCRTRIDRKAILRFKLPSDDNEDSSITGAIKAAQPLSAEGDDDADAKASEDVVMTAEQLAEVERTERRRTDQAKRSIEQTQNDSLTRLRAMDQARRQRIDSVDMYGEYGTKIDFLIKSILLAHIESSGARHVVFSNWHDSLKIVVNALTANGIKYASFDTVRGRKSTKDVVDDFIKDKSITVFLLHAERESAGLTLTTCNTVHLLEPVLKHSFELQAIGRVDRLGQKHETSVYCYYTQDTVEARILASNVRNGTSIYLKPSDAESGMAESNMAHVAAGASKGGDLGASEGEDRDLELLSLIL